MQEEEQCLENNHLEVWEGLDNTGQLLGRFCAGRLPRPITSRGAALHVNLVSPHNNFHGWFSAAYSVLSNGTAIARRSATQRDVTRVSDQIECAFLKAPIFPRLRSLRRHVQRRDGQHRVAGVPGQLPA